MKPGIPLIDGVTGVSICFVSAVHRKDRVSRMMIHKKSERGDVDFATFENVVRHQDVALPVHDLPELIIVAADIFERFVVTDEDKLRLDEGISMPIDRARSMAF